MTNLFEDQRWKEHLERHKNTTDNPARPYCADQGIQFTTSQLQAHIHNEHPRRENMLTTFNQNYPLPCIFHLILGCNVSFPKWEDNAWRSHNISHFRHIGPPNHATCIFCEAKFLEEDPYTCWNLFFTHTFDHLVNGYKIDHSRPIFHVLRYMYETNCMSQEDYDHCMAYTERPLVESLRPRDYVPPELVEKAEIAAEKENQFIVDDRRERRERREGQLIQRKRHRQRSKLPPKISY